MRDACLSRGAFYLRSNDQARETGRIRINLSQIFRPTANPSRLTNWQRVRRERNVEVKCSIYDLTFFSSCLFGGGS